MRPTEAITVRALDVEGRLKYCWPAVLLAEEEGLIVLCGDWERPLQYPHGASVPITNRSLEFYWLDQPYVISALFDRAWQLKEYYARVTLPPQYDKSFKRLSFVMLGLDLQIKPDYEYDLLEYPDSEDSPAQIERRDGLMALIELIERREGPFNFEFLGSYLKRACRGS